MAGLKLSHIYKVYENGHKAVNDFNIDIADKEFIVFVGPSGCGKSTTLRMVAGLEEISAGDLFIGDTLVNDMEPKDRDIAMVFQNYALYPHMSVFDNMAFGLRNRKVPEPEIKEAVTNAAKILGIEDYLDRKPKAMSGGQRQRVALGRAIVRKPKVFLFDEPLSNLDAKLRAQMRTEITKLHKKLETTFIYVTHDQIEAMTMGTRIVVMKLGYVQQIDTPMNLYNKPHNKFVAGFIGTPQMNFFDVTLKREGDNVKMTFVNTGDVLTIPYEKLAKAPDRFLHGDVVVTFGIRPDHVRIVEEETGLSCVANVVEHLGNECLVYGDVAGKNGEENESLSNVNQIIVKTIETPEYQPGMKFNLTIDLDRIHLFEKSPELDEKAEDFKIKDALPTRDVTILEDIPAYSTFPAKIAGGKIALLDANVELPPALKDALEGASEIKVDIPANAAIPGKDYSLTVHNCEEIDGKYLLHLVVGDRYLFLLNDEPVKVGSKFSFALRNDKLVFHGANNELLLDAIPDNNTFIGTFAKSEKRENHERVIDFFYNINEAHILAPRNNGYRINAVEGNKCYRNEYKYVVPVECVTLGDPIQAPAVEGKPSKIITPTEGINANVTGLLDYGNIVYATLQLGEQKGLAIVERGAALNDVSVRFGGENVEVYSIDIDMRVC